MAYTPSESIPVGSASLENLSGGASDAPNRLCCGSHGILHTPCEDECHNSKHQVEAISSGIENSVSELVVRVTVTHPFRISPKDYLTYIKS